LGGEKREEKAAGFGNWPSQTGQLIKHIRPQGNSQQNKERKRAKEGGRIFARKRGRTERGSAN